MHGLSAGFRCTVQEHATSCPRDRPDGLRPRELRCLRPRPAIAADAVTSTAPAHRAADLAVKLGESGTQPLAGLRLGVARNFFTGFDEAGCATLDKDD